MTWSDTFLGILKDNDIRLISYVPDNVLTPLLKGVAADNYFLSVGATREDEAIGTVTGAYMAGLVAHLKHDEAVIGGIGNSNFDLFAAGHRPQNFYMLGSMGLACPIALGVALAQPERGVIALEGDGSILMGLGCLATIATMKPRNLTIIIWDNGIYQITGKQPAATGGVTDIVAVARGAGIPNAEWVRDDAHFDTLLDRRFDDGGPVLLAAKIDDQPGKVQTVRDPALIRSRFMKGLSTSRGGALDQ